MSVHPTSKTRSFAAVGSIIASLAFTGVASADEPTITRVDGNPRCSSVDSKFFEVKIDPVRQGKTVFGDGRISGSIVVDGVYFDWTATPGVDAVIVKGGPTANVYRAIDEMTAGTNWHAPINPNNGKPYGLSHISFCSDGVDYQPPSRQPEQPGPCEPGGPATMPDGSACTPPGPCEPGGPTTMPDGKPCEAPPAESTEAPRGEVLGVVVRGQKPTPATALMNAPSTCVKNSYVSLVRGEGIRRVTMFVNGKRIKTFRGARSKYAVKVDPKRYPSGVMRLRARVEFVSSSGRRPQTFRMTVLACARAAVQQAPAFAG